MGTGRGTTGRVRVGASASWTGAETRATRVGGSRGPTDRVHDDDAGSARVSPSSPPRARTCHFLVVPAARIPRAAPRPRPAARRATPRERRGDGDSPREASDDWRRARARVPLAARLRVSAGAHAAFGVTAIALTRRPSDVKSRPVSERAGCGGGERPSVPKSPLEEAIFSALFESKWIIVWRAVRFRERFRRFVPVPAQHDFVASARFVGSFATSRPHHTDRGTNRTAMATASPLASTLPSGAHRHSKPRGASASKTRAPRSAPRARAAVEGARPSLFCPARARR